MKWKAKYHRALNMPQSWQQLNLGEAYCNTLLQTLMPFIQNKGIEQALHIGGLSCELAWSAPIEHNIFLYPEISATLREKICSTPLSNHRSFVQADINTLPFVESSIDMCLLANTLNFCQDPHQLLRECNRVLNENGYLFITLFNPASPLLFKRNMQQKSEQIKLFSRKYSAWRVIDWLEVLGFELQTKKVLFYPKWLPHFTHCGELILLIAQKRTIPLNLNPEKIRFKKPNLISIEVFSQPLSRNTDKKQAD